MRKLDLPDQSWSVEDAEKSDQPQTTAQSGQVQTTTDGGAYRHFHYSF
jgi:hypothetical protein